MEDFRRDIMVEILLGVLVLAIILQNGLFSFLALYGISLIIVLIGCVLLPFPLGFIFLCFAAWKVLDWKKG